MNLRNSRLVLIASALTVFGSAIAGTPCPDPESADVQSGTCVYHPGYYTLPEYYTTTDPVTKNGKCVSPGNSDHKCGETNDWYNYDVADLSDEYFTWPGHYGSCSTQSATCVRVNGHRLNEACDYNRCDPVPL